MCDRFKRGAPFLHAAVLIDSFNEALAEEIAFLRNEGGRPLTLLDGVLVYRGQEGFLYAFDLEVDAFLLDGTPGRLRCGFRETAGEVVSIRGVELTLAMHEDMVNSWNGRNCSANPGFCWPPCRSA